MRHAVGVLDHVVAAQQHRTARAQDDVGVFEIAHAAHVPSIRRANRSSRSRHVNAPKNMSSRS